jgi:UDP-N-acetylglucosamine transferase subunit ALG13
MIFLTVGTQFPFDRLVKAVDDLFDRGLIHEQVVAQIGDGKYWPRHFEAVASLDKSAFDLNIRHASAIISHAGMGTITMALENSKPLLAMPRRKKYGEVVNDHQVVLAIKFEALGHILLARDETELADKIAGLKSFVPRPRKADPGAVARRIDVFLGQA